jgi:hypothetical protein
MCKRNADVGGGVRSTTADNPNKMKGYARSDALETGDLLHTVSRLMPTS